MGAIDVSHVSYKLDDGTVLFDDVTFSVGDGSTVALVGANGVGKTTLLRLISGDLKPGAGSVAVSGRTGVLRQFVARGDETVRDLLLGLMDDPLRAAAERLERAQTGLDGSDKAALRYGDALAEWGEAGGYDAEVLWDTCSVATLRQTWSEAADRPVRELSGGEQKRLALECLLRGTSDVLLLDEPDNFLDVGAKEWLEGELRSTQKTALFVSHDRAMLAATAAKIVTVEGRGAWVHGDGFATWHAARQARLERVDEVHRRHQEQRAHLVENVRVMRDRARISDQNASRYKAAQTRLRRFDEEVAAPPRPREERIDVRLEGGRTGRRAVAVEDLVLTGLTAAFSTEVLFGERVAVVGPNGTGKSHFLRLLCGDDVAHSGQYRLGARVNAGRFAQTHDDPSVTGRTPIEVLWREGNDRGAAMAFLRRYELHERGDLPFELLSGGQQARLLILLLEVRGANLLLLDEPTDNLDIASAEALEEGLSQFEGTVLAATHDRWFMRGFDRFLIFERDGAVREADSSPT